MVTIDLSSRDEGRRSRTRARRRAAPATDAAATTPSAKKRARTLSTRHMRRDEARSHPRELLRVIDDERPRTRAECRDGPRPCLYVSCRFHLYLDVNESGSLKLNHPDREPWELTETCALDIAERGGLTHDEIGRLLNVTRERARQLEEAGLTKLKRDL